MAEKELRKMNRTELIEIIYALQQNDKILQEETEELRRQLDDRTIRMENAGSIAEAALSLNHIFEDAEAAARQYLDSLKAAHEPQARAKDSQTQEAGAAQTRENGEDHWNDVQQENDALRKDAQQENDALRKDMQQENDALRKDAQQECDALRKAAQQECDDFRKDVQKECERLRQETQQECEELRAQTQVELDGLRLQTQQECDGHRTQTQQECDVLLMKTQQECEELRMQTQQECAGIREQTQRQAEKKIETVNREIKAILDQYPMLREYLKREIKKE
ncbi:MAG: hypothetical protein LUF27_06560 [Lachnospiraceae bacterium]|nr:hypothetical protein [Lachnospiraceae bacterium]